MGMYMISKWFDLITRKTIGDVGLHNLVFGDTGIYLSFGGSVESALDTARPFYNAIEPVVTENALALGNELTVRASQVDRMSEELATQILLHPNYVAAFATAMIVSTASAVVGIAIHDDIKNPEKNYRSRLRGSFENTLQNTDTGVGVSRTTDKILLDTPQNTPRESYETMEHLKGAFDKLSPEEQRHVNELYEKDKKKRFEDLSPEDREVRSSFKDKEREIRANYTEEQLKEDDELIRIHEKEVLDRFTEKYLEEKKRIAQEEKAAADADKGFLGRVSGFFTPKKGGGSKKKRKGSAKKSTRKHKKKSGKKGKSHKRKGSNKKRRHTRR